MRADPADALALWLSRHGIDAADVRVSARARDRFAARVVPESYTDDYFEPIRVAARETNSVEARRDNMLVFNPRRLLAELELTADALAECTHTDCDRNAERYVIFADADVVREYCPEHAERAETMLTA
jgi:hypothetical protein